MNRLSPIVFFLLFVYHAQAEQMYVTFSDPGSAALQKSDLRMKLDKKDVEITELVLVDTTTESAFLHPAGRRHYVLLFDLVFNNPEPLLQARNAAEQFLARAGKNDLIAVAGISQKKGLRFYSSFTADRTKAITGMNALVSEPLPGMLEGPEGNLYPSNFGTDEGIGLFPAEQFLKNAKQFQPDLKKRNELRTILLQGILDTAYLLTTVAGRKNVILFSPGIDTKGISLKDRNRATEFQERALEAGSEETGAERQAERLMVEEELRRAEREARSNLPFSVEGITEFITASDSHFSIFTTGSEGHDFYKDLTMQTGGVLTPIDQAETRIEQILSSDKRYYAIGFPATSEKQFKQLHEVTISSSSQQIKAPSRWIAPKSYDAYSPLEKKLHLAEALYKDYGQGPALFWTDYHFEDVTKLPCFVQLSGNDILKRQAKELSLVFHAYTLNETGEILDFAVVPLRLDLKNKTLLEKISSSGVKVWNVLLSDGGKTTVRSVIINTDTGETWTNSETLDLKKDGMTISRPLFPDVDLNWLPWPNPQQAQSRRGLSIPYPYTIGPEQYFSPDISPEMNFGGKSNVVYFRIYNKPEGNPPVKFRLGQLNGKRVEISEFGLMQKPNPVPGGLELFWKITALPDIQPGPSQLEVELGDKTQKIVRVAPVLLKK